MIENKSINGKSYFLGQYMTPEELTDELIKKLNFDNSLIIEPSFGCGNFIKSLKKVLNDDYEIIGCELDKNLFETTSEISFFRYNQNFYDFQIQSEKKIIFVGNPPFRTPALSLTTHKTYIKNLCKKYNIKGIREESVFFILKCLELIENNGTGGEIHFILPKTIFTNNSKFFKRVQELINSKFKIQNLIEVDSKMFENVSLDMVFISLIYQENEMKIKTKTNEEYWDYTKIFKRTYLGSVPCESIFLSVRNETKENFQKRLIKLFTDDEENINDNLKYGGIYHLKVLNGNNNDLIQAKLNKIKSYVLSVKSVLGADLLTELSNKDNFKKINHRKEIRYYFRNVILKKCDFVYEINPNPQKSFYFTGNPSKSSTDYFGYCDYDITRNSSPGACRTIPLDNLEENLNEDFKEWLQENGFKKYEDIFELFLTTSKSNWYKTMKKKYNRFYFGVPKNLNDLN